MKRIGYIVAAFPGITETFIGTEIRAIQRQGLSITPIVIRDTQHQIQPIDQMLYEARKAIADKSRLQVIIEGLKTINKISAALPFLLRQQSLGRASLLSNSLRIAALAKELEVDHLHAHFAQGQAAHAIVAAKLLGITVSFTGHGHDIYSAPEDLPLKLQHADFAVAVCCDLAKHFKQIYTSANVATIFCGIDMNRFDIKPITTPENRLLFIGRLIEKKGLKTLFNALANIHPSIRPGVDLVGDGPLRYELEQLSRKLDLSSSIKFLGFKSTNWIVRNSQAYSALIAPYELAENGDRDTGPIVVKEAMALNLPVITTRFMGLKEMVTTDCAFIAQPHDVNGLKSVIEQCINTPLVDRQEMAMRARARLLQWFTDETQATELIHWFKFLRPKTNDICQKLIDD